MSCWPSGVFFIPYILFMFTCGVPLFFLETALGQYTNQGGITCWRRICPLFQGRHEPTGAPSLAVQCAHNTAIFLCFIFCFCAGMGYASHLIIAFSATSYIIVITWAFFYLFSSFSAELPWATCGNYWNTGRIHTACTLYHRCADSLQLSQKIYIFLRAVTL